MMLCRESFIFYRSFFEALNDLDTNTQAMVFCAICELALNGKEIELSGIAKTIFTLIKPQILANNQKYLNGKKGGEFGKKGGAPKGNQNARKQPQNNPKTTRNVNENVNDNVNDNVNVNEIHKETFVSAIDSYTDNPELIESLKNYVDMRKKMRGFTVKALQLNLKELDNLAVNDAMKIEILNQSISRSWKGLFPLAKENVKKEIIEEMPF